MISPVGLDLIPDALLGPIAKLLGLSSDGIALNSDQWDGYTADRHALLGALHDQRVVNTVFLTGDIHSSWASDVPLDAAAYPSSSPSVATEFVTTSVTSDNVDDFLKLPARTASLLAEGAIKALNRHIRYVEVDSHGFCVVDVRADRLQTDWWYISDRADRAATVRPGASYAVAANTQRVAKASAPV
jgi:alkaline phosphatase D